MQGNSLLLQTDLNAVIAERMVGISENLRLSLREKKIRFRSLKASEDAVTFALRDDIVDASSQSQLDGIFRDLGRDFDNQRTGGKSLSAVKEATKSGQPDS